jgi:hypothetical protein
MTAGAARSTAPDLSAATAWLAARSASERKRRGQWVTPWPLVTAVVERAVRGVPQGGTVVDPACGDARFLLAVGLRRPDLQLVGIDSDPLAIEAATSTLRAAGVSAELRCADALVQPLPDADLVIGNPPWVRVQNLDLATRRSLWARFHAATDKNDLATCFVEHALSCSRRTALVLPLNWLSLNSFAALRGLVLSAGVDGLFRLPDDLFGARVQSVALFTGAADRRQAGVYEGGELSVRATLHVGPHSWSLDGPPPELPGVPLGELATVHMGVVCGDYPRYVHQGERGPLDQPTCRGRHVQRGHIDPCDDWLRYDPRDMLDRKPWVAPKHAGIFDVPDKVVLAGASGRVLRAAVDTERRFPLDSCYVLHPTAEGLCSWALAGLLNSPQASAWYGARYPAARVKGVEVKRLPLPTTGWSEVAEAYRSGDDDALQVAVAKAYAATAAARVEGQQVGR